MGEVSLGNLYEFNKQFMEKEPAMAEEDIRAAINNICSFYNKNGNCTYHYYMLLCRERYDYTLFNNAKHGAMLLNSSFPQDLYECLTNRGQVLSIEEVPGNAYEIWLRICEDEIDEEKPSHYAFYFFPYDEGVITIEGK